MPHLPLKSLTTAAASGPDDPVLHCLVFAAGYRTEHLVLNVSSQVDETALTAQVATASALVQRLSPAHLLPARPQPGCGYASFLVVPDWVPEDRRQVVLLDFSRLRGPTYAHVFHNPLTYRDLETAVAMRTDELWHAYMPNEFEPLAAGSEAHLAGGDVICISPRDEPLIRDADLSVLLASPSAWQREPDQILLERPTSAWLVIMPQTVCSFPFYGTFTDDLQQAIADHMDRQVQHVSFGHPTEPLADVVHHGLLYDKICAVDFRAEHLPPGPNLGSFVFLDARQTARGLGFLFEGDGLVVPTQDGVRMLGLRPPRGFRTFAEHDLLRREGLPVADGRVLTLGYEYEDAPVDAASVASPRTACPASAANACPLTAASAPVPPHVGLGSPIHVGFLVLCPRVAPATYELSLDIPCTPQRACDALLARRRELLETTYEHLVVAQPQPDSRFCTFIALPGWATQAVCVIVDARAIDGRLFAACFESGIYPGSVLAQVSLKPSLGFRVAHQGHLHQAHEALFLSKGDVIFLLPAQAALPGVSWLPDMLNQPDGWHLPVPDFGGFLQTPFYLLTDAWNTIVDFPASASTSYVALRQFAVAFLRYEEHRASLQTLHPRVADYNFQGFVCRAVLIATEQPIGPPLPPARPRPPCIAYAVDRRAMLADITWHIAPTGRVDLDLLLQEFDPMPSGFYTSVLKVAYEDDLLEPGATEGPIPPDDESDADDSSSTSSVPPVRRQHIAHRLRCAKLLLEPQSDSAASRHALAVLRYFAPRLGEAWRYLPAADAEVIPGSSDSEDPEDADIADRLALFALYAPGYAPEHVAVFIRYPATLIEALDTVHHARNSVHSQWFHVLAPAEPQPQQGIGVVVAIADWQRQGQIVCLDTTRLDGRRFAVAAPSYADKIALLHLADIQFNLGVAVYVGDGPQPLGTDVRVHLWTGLVVFFTPPEFVPPRPLSLAWMLTDWRMWRRSMPAAEHAAPDAYALVYHDEIVLHLTDPRRPTRHRPQVAAALGIPLASLQLVPAVPRVTDATLNGLLCRTILAVCNGAETGPPPWCAVLLDLRALGRGWQTFIARRHRLSCDTLRVDLGQGSPEGWQACLHNIPDGLDEIDVYPGQVLVAFYRIGRVAIPAARVTGHASAGPLDQQHAAVTAAPDDDAPLRHPTGPPQSFGPTANPSGSAASSGLPTAVSDDTAVADGSATAPAVDLPDAYLPGTFFVLAQDYCPELVHARLPVGCPENLALERVGAARAPFSRLCMPRLVVAYPQTIPGVAFILALPFWTPDGVTIACDLTRINGAVFALQLPRVARRDDLLRALGVAADAVVDLYLRDLPWPLPRGAVYDLRTGDTVVVTPVAQAAHVPIPTRSLGALLASPHDWNPDWAPDAVYQDTVWLLADTGNFMFIVPPGRRSFFRDDVAAAVHARPDSLMLVAPDPAIRDHAAQGVLSLNVIAVLGADPLNHEARHGGVLCYIDGRPALSGITRLATGSTGPDGHGQTSWRTDAGTGGTERPGDVAAPPPGSTAAVSTSFDTSRGNHVSRVVKWRQVSSLAFTSILLHGGLRLISCSLAIVRALGALGVLLALLPAQLIRGHGRGRHPGWPPLLVLLLLAAVTIPVVTAAPTDTTPGDIGLPPALPPCRHAVSNAAASMQPHRAPPLAQTRPRPGIALGLPTLLDLAAERDSTWAFLASTLLETLFEHCAHAAPAAASRSCVAHSKGSSERPERVIQLAEAVPLTDYQTDCLELQTLVPAVAAASDPDWLDNDLRPLCTAPDTSPEVKAAIPTFAYWHTNGASGSNAATSVHVYTDGSACGKHEPLASAPCGWAFNVWVETAGTWYFYGFAAGTAVAPFTRFFLGESDDSPLTSELLGIAWALTWIIEHGPTFCCPVHLHYDCTAAGEGTFAHALPSRVSGVTGGPCLSHVTVALRHIAETRVTLTSDYTPGHQGVLGNELSDALAKYTRRQIPPIDERVLPEWPGCLVAHKLFDWAWLAHIAAPDLPTLFAFESEARRLQALAPEPRPPPRCGVVRSQDQPPQSVRYHITAVTFNVLTLLESAHAKRQAKVHAGLRILGRRHVILRQLQSQSVLFAGLQETRVQDTAQLPDRTHILLHSGANEAGNYGCALWISKDIPYATVAGKPLCLEPQHCTVSATSPRHLVVCVEAPYLRLGVLVVHAPSDPQDEHGILHAFWAARTQDLGRLPKDVPILLLADANSRLGSLESEAVGSHHAETETPAAAHFHSFLLRNGLWLPATFPEAHNGASWTWQSPHGDQHRIDYVGIPQSWARFVCRSRVWHTFEALQRRCDHLPVILECTFAREGRSHTADAFRRIACRPNDLDPDVDRQAFSQAVHSAPLVAWTADVDSHFASFVRVWTAAGRSVQPHSPARPQQSFLTAHTLGVIRARKDTRLALRVAEKELQRRLLVTAFAAFTHSRAGSRLTATDVAATWHWVKQANQRLAVTWGQLNRLGTDVRQAVKTDRCRYLEKLVSEVGQADMRDPRHLYHCVRKAFPKAASAKRSRFTPLPAVALANGELATTRAERAARWNGHFAAQECGETVTPSAYAQQFATDGQHRSSVVPAFDPLLLPSLGELEGSVLQLKRGKAAGPDGVTSELLKLAVPTAARQLLPLFVKSLLTLREPIEFKGGALMTLAKKASAAFECDKYRSILLSSVPGKLLHKSLRKRITPLLRRVGHDLMGGVHPGVGVDSIATAVRSFQAHAHALGEHPAVVFFDVRAAYYQVVRETLTSATPDDFVIRSLFHKLGVPPAALEELRDHLTSLNHIADGGGSLHLEAITRELFRGTWFRLDQRAELVATAAGVRPGDPLADVFFALSFSAYIRSVQTSLQREALVTVLPPCATRLPVDGLAEARDLPPASWADDFAAMMSAANPPQVVSKVRATTSAFLTHATSIGMQLSFAVDKTAALLPPAVLFAGVCDPPPSGAAYSHAIPVHDGVTGCVVHLPAVQAYKHLGGIVTCSASLLPEIYYRYSQCTWTLRPLRGTLFGNPSIPLPLRRTLLGSLVATKFTYGSATMELHVAYQWRLWARLYTSIWKALQPRSSSARKIHSYEVLRQAQALAPPLALAKARASLYLRVLEHGPQTLLHLWWLQWESSPERSWLAMLKGDIEYVAMYCPAAKLVLDSPCPLLALTEAMLQDRTWWRRQINAATRIYFADLDRWARLRAEPTGQLSPSPPPAEADFQCPFCSASFPLKKHLSVHIVRRHGLPAPKRLFAPHATCLACLKHFHTIPRAQNHLKSVPRCLARVHLLMPPLDLPAVRAIEQADRAHQKRLRTGCWQAFDANQPVLQAYGPAQPTRAELLSALGEDAPISLLVQPPQNPAFAAWVCSDIHTRTREPPRAGTRSFWWKRIQ
ncbi:CFDP2 [Symbiodinium sp. CCMP2592]|nr:CFDP2 [Symbiodinium sp. CCMP2592]